MDERANIGRLEEVLRSHVGKDDFHQVASAVVDELKDLADPSRAIEPILNLMETHPAADFGTPGPLVHFLETFYGRGYEEKLVESLARRPTNHTVWMLNRIINGVDGSEKQYFLAVLDKVIVHPENDPEAREEARTFRSRHP